VFVSPKKTIAATNLAYSPYDISLGGRIYAKESGLAFYSEQEDYNPYDNEYD
jgi:hypothetical protein